jgi:hypothetical protein
MEDDGGGAGEGARSQGANKRGRGGAMRGSAEAAWGQPPALLPPPQGAGASASRICRVGSSGRKDRHSKVYTAKGIRDRRVRLSVPTAIQFYDLQDRLGYDQPSKAIEWLINAAAAAIDKLPALDLASFALVPADPDEPKVKQQSKSGGSSTSETSKGSELSLSRSDSRASASAPRDREVTVASSSAQAASFTELLTGAAEHRQAWHQPPNVSAADCVGVAHAEKAANGLSTHAFAAPTFIKFGNAPPFGMVPAQPFSFPASAEMPHYSLAQDALAAAPAGDYNLNFSMSSGFLGTLQSNSQSSFSGHQQQQQFQRLDGPFLFCHAAAAQPSSENHQLTASAALQLWDGFRHSGMKEKSKN